MNVTSRIRISSWPMIMFHSKNLYSLLVLSIIVCLSTCDLEDLCDVSNDCEGKEVGTLIQDPLNCHRFYQCVLNSEGEVRISVQTLCDPKTCEGLPDGTRIAVPYDCFLFQICNHEVDLPIYGTCLLSNPYFNGTDCCFDAFSCCNICMPYCQFANAQVEDPANCNRYYLCEKDDYIPGSSEHFDCPEDTHFDRTLGECVEGYECDTVCVHGIDKRK
ncbi:hypothetical protein Avbf_00225, partial [Armadillidium vulgare]